MMNSSVAPTQNSKDWGPRAQQYFQALHGKQQTGFLQAAQQPRDLREIFRAVRSDVNRAADSHRGQDGVTLSAEAQEALRSR